MELISVLKKAIFFTSLFWLVWSNSVFGKPCYSSVVIEYPSRTVLFSENSAVVNQPASLTKVMTLYLVFKALDNGRLKLSQSVPISAHAANRQPSKLGVKPHDTITVEEAICGIVTKSANDAASVLAESLAPSEEEFAILMTREAQRLGMKDTVFKNASGIANPQQVTTAMDMAILGASIMHDFPHYYHYFALRQFNYNRHVFKNHNHLLGKYEGCDGIKTGFTNASGFNLISSAIRDGQRLIAVVLGGCSIKSRDKRMMQLLDIGFSKLGTSKSPEVAKSPNNTMIQSKTAANVQPDIETPNTMVEVAF
jgi:D-alanyl-D-alanine carboxypeptidase